MGIELEVVWYISRSPSFRHQAINKLPVNDINPSLPPSPPPSLLFSSGPGSTLRLHYINGTTNPPAASLHLRNTPINSPFPPLRHKHNRRRQAKILPHLEPLDRHHPKSNPNIRPPRDAKVNGDLPHLP